MCKIGDIRDLEIREAFGKLYEDSVLKDEFKIVKRKGLTHDLVFLQVFKTKWINIVLSITHDGHIWLENDR